MNECIGNMATQQQKELLKEFYAILFTTQRHAKRNYSSRNKSLLRSTPQSVYDQLTHVLMLFGKQRPTQQDINDLVKRFSFF
jgi:hypothetical protein